MNNDAEILNILRNIDRNTVDLHGRLDRLERQISNIEATVIDISRTVTRRG